MTNQAAQTMPELPEPLISGGNDNSRPDLGRGCTGYTAAQVQQYAIDYAAALALSRGVPEGCIAELKKARDGWEGEAQRIRIARDYWRMRCQMIEEYRDRENGRGVWFWQGDGADYPDSMAKDMTVVIRADELRELIKAAPAAAGAQGEVPNVSDVLLKTDDPIQQMRMVVRVARENDSLISRKWVEGWADQWERERRLTTPQPAADDGGVRERDLLADAIAQAGIKCGLLRPDIEGLTGPQLLMVCQDMADALSSHRQAGEPLAWCALTTAGSIAYFDGRPMLMVGPVGNEHHTVPLYTAPAPGPDWLRDAAAAFLGAADARDNEETSTQYPEHERRLRQYKAARADLESLLALVEKGAGS